MTRTDVIFATSITVAVVGYLTAAFLIRKMIKESRENTGRDIKTVGREVERSSTSVPRILANRRFEHPAYQKSFDRPIPLQPTRPTMPYDYRKDGE